MFKKIVCLGGGVIGSGWAARYINAGIDVTVYDPDQRSAHTVKSAIASARQAWEQLTVTLPAPGAIEIIHDFDSLTRALAHADLVQENLPETQTLKQQALAQIEPHLKKTAVIASSTSGLLPSKLQSVLTHPQRFCVAHPFTPVYLLPLVEICGGDRTDDSTKQQLAAFYTSIGMRPLVLKKEIDGFIADRLMEALWREALWLVHDDIATTAEIDDAIRLGCGLRWAFMGPFLTYRLGGGAGGMRHFMKQFAPALALPWTKLMDTPEMDDALVDKIVAQSDAQAGDADTEALVQWRDECLVNIMRTLAAAGTGINTAPGTAAQKPADDMERINTDAPLILQQRQVPAAWLDYNGHMTEWRYLQVFSNATDSLLRLIGVDNDYLTRGSYYTADTQLRHLSEAHVGDCLTSDVQILYADTKRLHIFHTLRRDTECIATAEQMLLHVAGGRVTEVADAKILNRIQTLAAAHTRLPRPAAAGKPIGSPVKKTPCPK